MSELTGFNRLKHDLLTAEEWQEFLRLAEAATDDQLRYVRDAANRPTASFDRKVEPAFTNARELRLLLLATKNSIPEWLRQPVMSSYQVINTTSPHATMHQVHARRLQTMLSINWSDIPPLEFDYQDTYQTLSAKLPGMEAVIKKVLNHLSLLKRADPGTHMQPIAFVGPPGVGKTTLVRELAHCLNRPFEQLQLASITDPEDVTGSSLVYENGQHGRVMDCFIRNRTPAIVLFMDEFCELYRSTNSHAAKVGSTFIDLLENGTFFDTFWGIPAHVAPLVFLTINDLEQIPEKIRQRLHIIASNPYLPEQKVTIIQKLWFDIQVNYHLEDVSLPRKSAEEILHCSRHEGGVRSVRESCLTLAANAAALESLPNEITPDFVREHLHAKPQPKLADKVGRAGAVAVDSRGNGTFSHITCVLEEDNHQNIMITGSIKEAAQESIRTALMVAHRLVKAYDDPRSVSIQVGSVGTPKDGPSAGVCAFAAIMSAYVNKPLPGDVAFTGEVCNDGSILPVGGILAKALAAQASGCTKFFVPEENLLAHTSGLTIQLIPVRDVQDVLQYLNL